jgi:hypothetical protein
MMVVPMGYAKLSKGWLSVEEIAGFIQSIFSDTPVG